MSALNVLVWMGIAAVVSLVASRAILRSWRDRVNVLIANAIVGAGMLALLSTTGAVTGVLGGDDPVMLASAWFVVPVIIATYLIVWGLSVARSNPAPGVARSVGVGLAVALLPSLAGVIALIMLFTMLVGA